VDAKLQNRRIKILTFISFILLFSCSGAQRDKNNTPGYSEEGKVLVLQGESTTSDRKDVIFATVDKEGMIHFEGKTITEEEFISLCREKLRQSKISSAILLVESGMIQGIHLAGMLSKIGYHNVEIYYPTATNR